jgi:hypothetical protein
VASGITNAFKRIEEAIILEDDCLPDPTFFPFCEELLARYRSEEKIAQIAGCSFQDPTKIPEHPDYYFSRYPHCWGWATWRRAWRHFDYDMKAWRRPAARAWLKDMFEHSDERRWWRVNFSNTAKNEIDTWAFRWTLTVFTKEWFGVLPYRNLVSNIGFGSDATHTRADDSPMNSIPTASFSFPLRHPNVLRRDQPADYYTGERHFRRPGLMDEAICRLRAFWSK